MAEAKWPSFCGRHFQIHFFNQNVYMFINISPNFIPMGPMCYKKEIVKKKGCRQILDSLEQTLWNVPVICIHFSHCCIFRCSIGCHSKGFTIESQGYWYALLRRSQCMIFKFNVLSTHIFANQLRLQGSVKYSPKSSNLISIISICITCMHLYLLHIRHIKIPGSHKH